MKPFKSRSNSPLRRSWSGLASVLLGIAFAGTAVGQPIRNDQFWKTTSGSTIYSQGGGVIKVGDTWYWYGVKYDGAVTYAAAPTAKNSNTTFAGVTCYSSKDLVNWKDEGLALAPDQAGSGWFGRVGVVYNSKTKMYVLIGQGSSPAGVGGEYFATSATPDGAFKFNNVQTDMTFFVNGGTGDQTTFQDDDGKAYVICSSVSGRSNLYVAPLRASDFLAIESTPTKIYKGNGREGNAMFKYNGTYYFCSSDLHGWNASHTYCMSSSSIQGTYSSEFVMNGTDADFSHVSQTGFFFAVKGTKQTTIVFAGDRWSDFAGNGLGYNQWMPLSFSGTTPSMNSLSEWNLDATTGAWSVGDGNNWVLNPSFEADRVSQTTLAGWTDSTNRPAFPGGNISGGHTGRWALNLYDSAAYIAKKSQSITGLPKATYKLSAWVRSSGGQKSASLYAKTSAGKMFEISVSSAIADWKLVSVAGISVTDGKLEVGARSNANAGNWVRIDDIQLVKDASASIAAAQPQYDVDWRISSTRVGVLLPEGGELSLFGLDGRPVQRIEGQGFLELRLDRPGVLLARVRSRDGRSMETRMVQGLLELPKGR